jgi:fatty acid desaturase
MPVTRELPLKIDLADSLDKPDSPYKRGYQPPPRLRSEIGAAHRTDLPVTAGAAMLDHAGVAVAGLLAAAAGAVTPWPVVGLAVIAAAVLVGRQLRALENLVHEGSHFNWDRTRRDRNDRWARWLAGYPTGGDLREYRAGHLLHHGRFGTAADPDLARYRELRLEQLDRTSTVRFARGLLTRFGAYQRGWLRTAGGGGTGWLVPPLYGVIVAGLPALVLGGWPGAALAGAAWALGYLLALPLIRLVAESGEHQYTGTRTVFDATYSNLGFWHRWLIHPHNDGYHTVHHLWPGVPQHRLRRLHRILLEADPDGYAARLRFRTSLLDARAPRKGSR